MDLRGSINQWRTLTKQLIIRSAELLLEARFPEMASGPNSIDNPLNYPWRKKFFGKFGLKRDLKTFPDFNKIGEVNSLALSFYVSPLSAKVSPRGESSKDCDNRGDIKTIETWNISLLINEDYTDDDKRLINCYSKILGNISSKVKELPSSEFVNKIGKRLGELEHILHYQLRSDPTSSTSPVEKTTSKCGISGVKSKTKSTEFKFDIGFGSIKYEIEYITIKSLAKINQYLLKNFDPAYSNIEESKIKHGFSNHSKSRDSSEDSKEEEYVALDDSDDFVLITTSDHFVDLKEDGKDLSHQDTKVNPQKSSSGVNDDDDYNFDSVALFNNKNPSSKIKDVPSLKYADPQRKRINSDTTACSRVKNMLTKLKLYENEKNPEVFEKKQFEFKNVVSPAYIDNLVINEAYFDRQDEPKPKKKESFHDDFEDDEFNPFRESSKKASDALSSPKSNQGPAFRGLREFRTSIDASDPNYMNNMTTRNLRGNKTHRKFTLSFDGDNKQSQEVEDSFVKLDDGISMPYKLNSFRENEEIIKEEEDASFEIEHEDDYFTDDLADFIPHIDKSLQINADTQEYDMGDESPYKSKMHGAKLGEEIIENNSAEFESILLSLGQAITDSTINNLDTSDDYCLFLNNMEDLRKRIDSRATEVSCDSYSSSRDRKSLTTSTDYNSETREILLNNYMEIIELKEKINKSSFDSILN
ncbi:unnamed protein product [Moneuplotes crassus]|uniref:Uncharacterized protein n=1 Tax=Euplotes crassus TaxID=5936 RepID=A0AAD1Y5S8_EUPCR|nr:unnamed protein product [Moneuplotes crassus]